MDMNVYQNEIRPAEFAVSQTNFTEMSFHPGLFSTGSFN